MAIITSPIRPGAIVPVTRPTFPSIRWSAKLDLTSPGDHACIARILDHRPARREDTARLLAKLSETGPQRGHVPRPWRGGMRDSWDPACYERFADEFRSEERRVGKECRSRWSP